MPASRQDLVDQLGLAMQRYQRSTQAFDDAVGRHLGLNPADLRCLDWLADGPKTAGHLAEATGLRPAATTTLIDRLEGKGLVRRVPGAQMPAGARGARPGQAAPGDSAGHHPDREHDPAGTGTLRDLDGKVLGRLSGPGTAGAHGVAATDSGDVYLAQLSGVVQKFVKQ